MATTDRPGSRLFVRNSTGLVRSASAVDATSCTRTPQTPAWAASALTIAVAKSRSEVGASVSAKPLRNRLRDAPIRSG